MGTLTAIYQMWPWILTIVIILFALAFMATATGPETPKPKSHDAIDEEIRRERMELHNTSLHYGELQRGWVQDTGPTPLTGKRLEGLLATAFREGAKWQQRRP